MESSRFAHLLGVGQVEVALGRSHLVGEVHGVQGQRIVLGPDGDQVLLVPHDQRGDGDPSRLGHGLAEQRVRLVGTGALGGQVVARAEVHGVDVDQSDEVGDLDLA